VNAEQSQVELTTFELRVVLAILLLGHIYIMCCYAIVGPALFLTCPMDIEKSQKWFTELWNDTIVPYLTHINKEFTVRVCVHTISVHELFALRNRL